MDLSDFERKLDQNVEDLKIIKSRKERRTLRIFVSNVTYPPFLKEKPSCSVLFPPEKIPEKIPEISINGINDKLLPQTWQLRVGVEEDYW